MLWFLSVEAASHVLAPARNTSTWFCTNSITGSLALAVGDAFCALRWDADIMKHKSKNRIKGSAPVEPSPSSLKRRGVKRADNLRLREWTDCGFMLPGSGFALHNYPSCVTVTLYPTSSHRRLLLEPEAVKPRRRGEGLGIDEGVAIGCRCAVCINGCPDAQVGG